MGILRGFYGGLLAAGQFVQDFFLLAIRLYWGWGLFQIGLGKLRDMAPVVASFKALGIPYPEFMGPVVGTLECVGGGMLVLGLASRLISIPIMIIMITAYFTAHSLAIKGVWSNPALLISQSPFYYLATSLIIFTFGPGRISFDGFLDRAYFKSGKV